MSQTEDEKLFFEKHGNKSELLGQGTYGDIYSTTKGKVFKIIYQLPEMYFDPGFVSEDMINEIVCHSALRGRSNVIQMEDFMFMNLKDPEEYNLTLVLERASGDARNYTKNMSVDDLKTFRTKFAVPAYQICLGIQQIHAQNIIHRDIKPMNILIVDGIWKIADFGLSKVNVCPYLEYTDRVYTITYRPPELLTEPGLEKVYDFSADIWALGVTLLEIYSGREDFFLDTPLGMKPPLRYGIPQPSAKSYIEEKDILLVVENVNRFLYNKQQNLQIIDDVKLRDLIDHMLEPDPKKRYSIDQVLSHPYFFPHIPPLSPSCFDRYLMNCLVIKGVDRSRSALMLDDDLRAIAENEVYSYAKPEAPIEIIIDSVFYLFSQLSYIISRKKIIKFKNTSTVRSLPNRFLKKEDLIKVISSIILKLYSSNAPDNTDVQYGEMSILYLLGGNISFSVASSFIPILPELPDPLQKELQELFNTHIELPLSTLVIDLFQKYGLLYSYTKFTPKEIANILTNDRYR